MLTVKGKKVGMKRRAIMRDFFERYSSCLKNPHDAKNAALCAGSISNWKKDLLFNEKSCPCSTMQAFVFGRYLKLRFSKEMILGN